MYKLDKTELTLRQEARGHYPEMPCWYVVMVHHGREERVQNGINEDLSTLGVSETFLPILQYSLNPKLQQSKASTEFLFRSYLFLRCVMTDEIYMSVCDHPLVYQILGQGYRIPTALDDAEIDHLRQILIVDCKPVVAPRLNVGASARIVEGLMAGMEGRIVASNAKTVKLEVSFSFLDMGTSVVVVVPRSDLQIEEKNIHASTSERICHV